MASARSGGATPYARRGRRPRWLLVGAVLLFVMPLVEIAAIIGVGKVIGTWPTVALLVVESLLGAWLMRREGGKAWDALREALRSGRMPSRQLADAALILIGGTLLLTPGFVTDLLGFFVILPPTRPVARRMLEQAVQRRLLGATGAWPPNGRPDTTTPPDVVQGRVVED